MRIAVDVSPLQNISAHKVRGTGSYTQMLRDGLLEYFPNNTYFFFNQKEDKIPKSDLVHFPYFEPFFLNLPLMLPKKTIITIHDLIPLVFNSKFPAGIRGSIAWGLQKQIIRFVSAIITDSKSSKRDILRILNISESKVNVVYLAVSSYFQKLEVKKKSYKEVINKYKLPAKFVLYVGDATWNKNLPNLVLALKKVKIPLVMVGKALLNSVASSNDWNISLNETIKAIEGDKNFLRLGFVPVNDLSILYNIAQLLVMPSFYEGFGLPVLEAMKCGCPVVTSKRGSIPEIGEDAVYYVDPESIESIAEAVKKVFENVNIQRALSAKGIIQAKKFASKKMIEDTVSVYESVIKS